MVTRRQLLQGTSALAAAATVAPAAMAAPAAVPAAAPDATASPAAASRPGRPALRRGVNLSTWLQLDQRQAYGPEDLATIRAAGFDHVRICVDFEVLGWRPGAGTEVPGIAKLDAALALALDAGLAAILDCHGNAALHSALESRNGTADALVALWRTLAARYAGRPATSLAFELLNEPQYYSGPASRWPTLQRRLLAAVRDSAPDHLVLLTGRKGGRIDAMAEIERAPNVAASFHYYLPYVVTHQGAPWWAAEGETVGFLRRVPYPSARLREEPPEIDPRANRAKADKELARYAREGWGAARIAREIEAAAKWGRASGIPVVCPEFGVYRAFADPATRWGWIADVREALEARGIGWAVWDYADTFGITDVDGPSYTTADGAVMPAAPGARRRLDPRAYAALGLPR